MLGLYKAVFTFVFLLLSCVLKETLVEFLAHCMMTHCFSSTFDRSAGEGNLPWEAVALRHSGREAKSTRGGQGNKKTEALFPLARLVKMNRNNERLITVLLMK